MVMNRRHVQEFLLLSLEYYVLLFGNTVTFLPRNGVGAHGRAPLHTATEYVIVFIKTWTKRSDRQQGRRAKRARRALVKVDGI